MLRSMTYLWKFLALTARSLLVATMNQTQELQWLSGSHTYLARGIGVVEIALSRGSDGAKGLELRTCVVQGSVRITRQKK